MGEYQNTTVNFLCGGAMNAQHNRSMFDMQDINASKETSYPVKNGNSMNKKLEAAKQWLKDHKT
jgi:hypothetical protein